MSSSAALECAVVFLLNEMLALGLSRVDMALLAQRAENEYGGVNCGIMDQVANMMGMAGQVILLDCRNLDHRYMPFHFNDVTVVLFDTGVKHSLASSEYNTRRMQCEAGVAVIQKKHPAVSSLRDATLPMVEECLAAGNADIYKRCRYVVAEIQRTQDACKNLEENDIASFGRKMFATHEGLRKDYEVSCEELDFLVEQARHYKAVMGARMMGGGFGGCTINLIQKDSVNEVIEKITAAYGERFNMPLQHYLVAIEDGIQLVDI